MHGKLNTAHKIEYFFLLINLKHLCVGALPLSPLHVKAFADTEERVEQGHIQSV